MLLCSDFGFVLSLPLMIRILQDINIGKLCIRHHITHSKIHILQLREVRIAS